MHFQKRNFALLLSLASLLAPALFAQSTGLITGTVTDQSGAVVPAAPITITNKDTGAARNVSANNEGIYSAPSLGAGTYEIRAEVKGFRTLVRDATVDAGSNTTVNLALSLGSANEVVTVEAATAQINYESHTIAGVIARENIQDLPLNGRNLLQLATLEPGITSAPASVGVFNSQFSIVILGTSNRGYFTVDGGSIVDNVEGAGTAMNFSNEIVQEFQTATVNFDLGTGIASAGSINIVTRSGSNDYHGSGYFFFRDHNMAAYPGLSRSALTTSPFFARRNPGLWVGGPIKKDKLFFFSNYEYTNQVQAVQVQPDLPSIRGLTNIFQSPYQQKSFTTRFDYRLSPKHNLFLRYSHDGNNGFGPQGTGVAEPSNWTNQINWADQAMFGITSVLTPTIVNDFRFAGFYWDRINTLPPESQCTFPCVGFGLPSVASVVGSSSFAFGNNAITPQIGITHRYQYIETLTWQKGNHRFRFGGQFYQDNSPIAWGFCTPACEGAVSPEFVASVVTDPTQRASIFPTLPTTIRTNADLLNLPLFGSQASSSGGIGIGSANNPGPYQNQGYHNNRPQIFAQDSWRVRPKLSINFGIQYQYESGVFNSDVPKPAFVAPLYGNDLSPTKVNHLEFSPSFGFAYSLNDKTVIRGGGGIYWDNQSYFQRYRDRNLITPLGNGRVTMSTNLIQNTIPGIVVVGAGGVTTPLAIGAQIPTGTLTNLTLGQFVGLLQAQVPALLAKFSSAQQTSGSIAVTPIDVAKSGVQLYPQNFPLPRSYQTSIGIQRDLGWGMVLTADYARKVTTEVQVGEEDLNHYNAFVGGKRSPVIPACAPANFTPGVECSNGPITFWVDGGRSVYNGLLMKLNKRFTHKFQGTVSYAFQSLDGISPSLVYNLNNYNQSFGPLLAHHNLNIAGIVQLPWGFQLSLNSSIISRTPFEAFVPGGDLTGTGANPTSSAQSMLPGVTYNCFNAGCSQSDLSKAVDAFNTTYAGTKFPNGNPIPKLILPTNYTFGDNVFSQNFRLLKTFKYKEHYQLQVMGEMFNALNIANLSGYGSQIDTVNANPAAQAYKFGQPTQRSAQTFGQTGPRAVQVGARITF
jgi:hypothetical protein